MKSNRFWRRPLLGYSLLEVILVLAVLTAGVVGVYMMLKPAGINAGVQQEQKQLDSLVSGVQSAFGTTGGSYENISVATARNLKLTGVEFNGNSLVSALGDTITLRPATVRQDHDAFDAVYQGLNSEKCLSYINAFFPQTYSILVGASQTSVQTTSGVNEGRLVSEDQLVTLCNTASFQNNQGQVAFRFFSPSAQSSSVVENVCACSPRTQERKLSCGTGQAGDITQERTSTCSGGTGSCPTEVWGVWNTTSNTCAGGLTPVVTPPSTPGTDLCVPTTERRTQSCPVGYNGSIVEERNSTCASPASNPVWGAWAVSDNSCVPNTGETYTCTPSVENRNRACPAPLMGSIVELRSSSCSHPNATPTWGPWVEQSQNCQQACVAGQSCCQPQPDQFRDVACPTGQYGLINERNSSYCASATSPLAWNGWQANGGGCSICPGPLTENDTPNWDPRSAPCPAGSTGSHTWEAQQTRSRIRTYNCNPSPVVLPPPSYTAWTTWSDTGVIRNEVNTCVSTSCTIPAGTTRTWTVGGNTCNGPALTSDVTIASGTSRAWNDVVAPTTGTASFQCNNTVLSTTPNAGATCNAPPPPSTCTAGTGPLLVFNSMPVTDGSDVSSDVFTGSASNWSAISGAGMACNASMEGRMIAIMQGGPVDIIEGTVYVCQGGSFIPLWSQNYSGGWDQVAVTPQGAAVMGVASGYHPNLSSLPAQWVPASPVSPTTGVDDWSDQPGSHKGADHMWVATTVCSGAPQVFTSISATPCRFTYRAPFGGSSPTFRIQLRVGDVAGPPVQFANPAQWSVAWTQERPGDPSTRMSMCSGAKEHCEAVMPNSFASAAYLYRATWTNSVTGQSHSTSWACEKENIGA